MFMSGGKREGAGRPLGSLNKIPSVLKDMILQALDDAGGVEYLRQQAVENPTAFLALIGKVLPMQITGGEGKEIVLQVITNVPAPVDALTHEHA